MDLLKMDIERFEFAVVYQLQNGYVPSQIVFETNLHNACGMWGWPFTETEWNGLWTTLRSLGHGLFSNEPHPFCQYKCRYTK